jgi:hypothetical protein
MDTDNYQLQRKIKGDYMSDKYIKSEHPYEVEIVGVLIPKRMYSVREMDYGKRSFIKVTDEKLEELKRDGVFQSLLGSGQYKIIERPPTELLSPSDKIKQMEQTNFEVLTAKEVEIRNLKQENKKLIEENIKMKTSIIESKPDTVILDNKSKQKGNRK